MISTETLALKQTILFFTLSQVIQTVEFLKMNKFFPKYNPWFSSAKELLQFKVVLWFRLILSMSLSYSMNSPLYFQAVLMTLFTMHLWTLVKMGGSFNGGSDDITTQTFLGLIICSVFNPVAGLWYLSLQLIYSYFAAGWIKIKNPEWRSGEALVYFLNAPQFALTPRLDLKNWNPKIIQLLCAGILTFELSSPLTLLFPSWTMTFLGLAGSFHFLNFLFFGLNRFFWGWITLYPALLYCSQFFKNS